MVSHRLKGDWRIGAPHPNPSKAAEFQRVDLGSIRAAAAAAQRTGARYFVYVSVAHPAPVMRAYIAARQESESLVMASGIPATRESAGRLGLGIGLSRGPTRKTA